MRFAAMFPHTWTGAYPSDDAINVARAEWGKMLDLLTLEQIAHGLEHLVNKGSKWPPAVPEFKAMCLKPKEVGHACHDLYKRNRALPDKNARERQKDTGRQHIGKLMAMLGGGK